VDSFSEVAIRFVTLLLLPTLGVLGLLEKRAIPVLSWTLVLWGVVGGWALWAEHTFGVGERSFRRGWIVGLGLGSAFLFVAWLREQPRVAAWLKLVLGGLTVAVFVRALFLFVARYS